MGRTVGKERITAGAMPLLGVQAGTLDTINHTHFHDSQIHAKAEEDSRDGAATGS